MSTENKTFSYEEFEQLYKEFCPFKSSAMVEKMMAEISDDSKHADLFCLRLTHKEVLLKFINDFQDYLQLIATLVMKYHASLKISSTHKNKKNKSFHKDFQLISKKITSFYHQTSQILTTLQSLQELSQRLLNQHHIDTIALNLKYS